MIYGTPSGNIVFGFLMSHLDTLSLNAFLLQLPNKLLQVRSLLSLCKMPIEQAVPNQVSELVIKRTYAWGFFGGTR